MKGSSDTSTAESGSEAEDIVSPKAVRSYSHLRLTPVREEVYLSILAQIHELAFLLLKGIVWTSLDKKARLTSNRGCLFDVLV